MYMRTPGVAFLLVLMAGTGASAQQGTQYYPPDRKTDTPTFMNAEVVRVNRPANTVTFRSESGETALTVEGEALSTLTTLRPGDKVVVGYRIVRSADGRATRVVTSVTSASPTSGTPGRRGVVAVLTPGSTVRARVLSYDPRERRVTLIDETGGLRAIVVNRGVSGLDILQPGANVSLNLTTAASGAAGAVNVAGITSLGNAPLFGTGIAFPPVNGQVVGFNQRTGLLTVDTATAGRVSFPVGSTVAGGLSGVQPGQNLSLTFDVTNAVNQARAGAVGVPLATITGVQPFIPNVAPVVAAGVTTAGATGVGTTGATAAGTAGTVGVAPGVVAAPVVTGGGVAQSPYVNPVPSIPAVTPAQAAVLPPAQAKEPLSAEEVGTMRAQAEADLANSAVALAAAANQIDAVWAGFKNQCLSGFTAATNTTSGREWYAVAEDRVPTPTDDACRALHADIMGRAQAFIAQLDTVEDAARKADVLPARVREVFERHKLR
jgi:hypothetical protein